MNIKRTGISGIQCESVSRTLTKCSESDENEECQFVDWAYNKEHEQKFQHMLNLVCIYRAFTKCACF